MSYPPERPPGEVFLDARGNGRAMRLTWHDEAGLVVLSLWRGDVCAGTFRLGVHDVADFVDALVDGLRDAPGVHPPRPQPSPDSVPGPRQAEEPVAPLPLTGQVVVAPTGGQQDQQPASFTDWAFGAHRSHTG